MGYGELLVRPLESRDLDAVTRVHLRSFDDAAMTRLGPRVVRRYYEWQLEDRHPLLVALAAEKDGTVLGYVIAGVIVGAQSVFVRQEWRLLAWSVARSPRNWTNPIVWDRLPVITDAVRRRLRSRAEAVKIASRPPRFGVLSIATDPDARGSGAASALLAAVDRAARDNGFEVMYLTVHVDNTHATGVYEHLGWSKQFEGCTCWRGTMTKRVADG